MNFARARMLPCGVSSEIQSPAAIPRAEAVDGCISTCGSRALLRSEATCRCWVSQKNSDFAQLRTSGYRSAEGAIYKYLVAYMGATDAQITDKADFRAGMPESLVAQIRSDPGH